MNKVIEMGRLTRNPDVRHSQGDNQMAVARFTLAVDRRMKKQEGKQSADFIPCVAFDRLGEFAEKYLKKGVRIVLEGRIQTGSYVNGEGQTVYRVEVVAENIEFAESKAASERNNAGQQWGDGFMDIPDGMDDQPSFG